jgi:hypothetical protein
MSQDEPTPVLSVAEAKKRFLFYFLLKIAGLAALFGGVFLGRGGVTAASVVLLLAGAASLFVRPKLLGLTTRPEKK